MDARLRTVVGRAVRGEGQHRRGGVPTTAACPAFAYVPTTSATCVDRLLEAGAVFVGKTNMDQFATGLSGARSPHGVVRSTIDPSLIGGGSSSGSAVAVATGDVVFALGTDTAGSGRVPAVCHGIIGSKPSVGLVSTRGVVPACPSLDCVSVFTREVGDAGAVIDVIAGFDAEDPFSRRLAPAVPTSSRVRIGVPADPGALTIPSVFERAAERVSVALAADLVPVDVTPHLEAGVLLYQGAWLAERFEAVGPFLDDHPSEVEPTVATIVGKGRDVTGAEVFADLHRREALARRADENWEHCDVLLLPTVDRVPTVDEMLAAPDRGQCSSRSVHHVREPAADGGGGLPRRRERRRHSVRALAHRSRGHRWMAARPRGARGRRPTLSG